MPDEYAPIRRIRLHKRGHGPDETVTAWPGEGSAPIFHASISSHPSQEQCWGMPDLTSHLLRAYFAATDWHPYNSYLHLTSSSSSILLDFPIPAGLSFSISACPSPIFYSTHRLRALPHLAGSLGYVFASTDRPLRLDGREGDGSGSSQYGATKDARLKDVLDRFRIVNSPTRPQSQAEAGGEESGGKNREYLLYGCVHAPTARLDALCTTRISPSWNFILTACSFPPRTSTAYNASQPGNAGSSTEPVSYSQGPTSPGATNLQVTLQQDTGKWFNEFSYSVDDALWGFRTMHNFGSSKRESGRASEATASAVSSSIPSPPATLPSPSLSSGSDDDSLASSEASGGLKGQFSAGAELFFSAEEKSAGLSTGVRFSTLPEDESQEGGTAGFVNGSGDEVTGEYGVARKSHVPSQPPTTITATLNPMMGHMSTAYAARIGRDIVACSRYDFNVYSYESQLTVGGEYWLRSSTQGDTEPVQATKVPGTPASFDERQELRARQLPANVSLRDRGITAPRPAPVLDHQISAAEAAVQLQSGTKVEGKGQLNPNESPARAKRAAVSDSSLGATPRTLPSSKSRVAPIEGLAGRTNDELLPTALTESPEPLIVSPNSRNPPRSLQTDGPRLSSTATTTTTGLLKWSLSSSLLLSLLWQGRLRNCVVAVGLRADLSGGGSGGDAGSNRSFAASKPGRMPGGVGSVIRGVGMDVVYWGGSSTADSEAEAEATSTSTSTSTSSADHASESPNIRFNARV